MVGDILQPTHLVFVLVVALLVLGPKRLPEVGRQLGNGLRDFRAAINGESTRARRGRRRRTSSDVSDTTAQHEFAHEPTVEVSSNGHEFAHESSAEATPGAQEPSRRPPGEHEFAHEPETVASSDAAPGTTPNSGHEFAYETSEPSDKRTDPLA